MLDEKQGKRMAELSIESCLDLCHQARSLEGAALTQTLNALQTALEQYQLHQLIPAGENSAASILPTESVSDALLDNILAISASESRQSAVLIVTLERVVAFRYSLGQLFSDQLVIQASRRLREVLEQDDVLIRSGTGKLTIALSHIKDRHQVAGMTQKILDSLHLPIIIDGNDFCLSAHIGIALFPPDGRDASSLVRCAESAMTRVKEESDIPYLFYRPEMQQHARESLRMESELRRALLTHQLQLFYQPKVSLRSGRIVGAEALIRWRHPVHGMMMPAEFLPMAEQTGLIIELGSWVLDEACRQIRLWQDGGMSSLPIAVNIASRQFDRHLPEQVRDALMRHQVSPGCLKLEITENLLLRAAENVISIMNELVAMGVELALDDFGTGYSSLAYLQKFPISTIKIDRAFVVGLPHAKTDCAIAGAIVTIGQELRQEIVAEGVENLEQMEFLRELGCNQVQGYLFSPAVPAQDFELMVRQARRLSFNTGYTLASRIIHG